MTRCVACREPRDESELGSSDSCRYHYRKDSSKAEDSDPSNVISPCGLIAWSVFNDSFSLFRTSDAKPIKLVEKGERALPHHHCPHAAAAGGHRRLAPPHADAAPTVAARCNALHQRKM